MMRTTKGKIAWRCATCLVLIGVAAWSTFTVVEGRQHAAARQIATDEYQALLQSHYSQHNHLPVGNVEELFARVR